MRNNTRLLYAAYLAQVAQLNQIGDATLSFNVAPAVQQTLEQRTQESSEFLSQINMIGVEELKGEKVGIGVSSTIAGRTDTSGAGVRSPRDVGQTDANDYECKQTDFDTAIRYAQLDAWAHRPEFQTLLRDAILRRQALDRLMIGFHGTSAACRPPIRRWERMTSVASFSVGAWLSLTSGKYLSCSRLRPTTTTRPGSRRCQGSIRLLTASYTSASRFL